MSSLFQQSSAIRQTNSRFKAFLIEQFSEIERSQVDNNEDIEEDEDKSQDSDDNVDDMNN